MKKAILFLSTMIFSYGFIYELQVKNGYNKDINFANFEDKALVIFISTKRLKINNELRKINKLYNRYKTQNIAFVGFALKETNSTKNDFCVINYGVNFEMIGTRNNESSKLKSYISHVYENNNLDLYAPILVYNREIIKFKNIYALQNKLMELFDSNL